MNKRLSESVKFITSQIPRAFTGAATTVNGRGVNLSEARKVIFRYQLGNVATTDNAYTFSVLEATDAAVTGARNIGNAVATPNVVLTPNVAGSIPNANIVQLTMNGAAAADEIVINGVTITARAAATSLANNEYDQRGDDTADAVELCAVINNALPDLVATNAAAVITIQSRVPGKETITVTGITAVARVIPVTVEAVAQIEVDASALSDGYDHVFPRSLTGGVSAGAVLHVTAITGNHRYGPVEQQVSDSDFIPNN